MTISEKLSILSDAAKYDVSCSSSGSNRANTKGGIGDAAACGICHSWSDDGRCISLLKVLMTNQCIYDCKYCLNRTSSDVRRAQFTPAELAELTIEFYKRNYIEGLFLSSGVVKSPDYTMECMIEVLSILRNQYRFGGYIHVKIIPGSDAALVDRACHLADRISVNIEVPSQKSLLMLAPQKNREAIIGPMKYISSQKQINAAQRKNSRFLPSFAPAGQSTQMIIGATSENDLQIIRLSQGLYDNYQLKRVYYSAYIPVGSHPSLPAPLTPPPLLREHRLYQADWLLRFYHFRAEELLDEGCPDFSNDLDPKCQWALRNIHLFPIDVNSADYETLLRVPGIGVLSARRIMRSRQLGSLSIGDLKKIGVVLKRARFFITTKHRTEAPFLLAKNAGAVRGYLCDGASNLQYEQLRF